MSILSRLQKHSFLITFSTLFIGMHYGWHLLQLKSEVNHGQPPKELPATIFVKYLAKEINLMMEGGENASSESPVAAPATNKQ